MERRIVIAGAGGFGREVHSWLVTSPRFCSERGVTSIVFINDEEPTVPVPAPIVSTISDFLPETNDLVICAIGDPVFRRQVTSALAARGVVFATFAHDSAIMGENVSLGEGAVVCPGTILTSDISVGSHVHININSSIGHDVAIGDFVTLSPSCNLMGGSAVQHDVFFGTAVTLVPGVTVHHDTMIGAGSVVIKDIEANVVAFGNPCRVSRRNEPRS